MQCEFRVLLSLVNYVKIQGNVVWSSRRVVDIIVHPLDTGRKLNVHNTAIRVKRSLPNVLYKFSFTSLCGACFHTNHVSFDLEA